MITMVQDSVSIYTFGLYNHQWWNGAIAIRSFISVQRIHYQFYIFCDGLFFGWLLANLINYNFTLDDLIIISILCMLFIASSFSFKKPWHKVLISYKVKSYNLDDYKMVQNWKFTVQFWEVFTGKQFYRYMYSDSKYYKVYPFSMIQQSL